MVLAGVGSPAESDYRRLRGAVPDGAALLLPPPPPGLVEAAPARVPASQPRPNPSTPRELGVPAKPKHHRSPPFPDRVGPTGKHSPAGRKGARSSGFASLCPALAPPLAPELPRSHFPHAPGNFLSAAAGSRQTNSPSSEHAARFSAPKIFFFFFRLLGFLRSLPIWIPSQPGADSSRRGGRRRLGRVAGPGSRPGSRNCADCAPGASLRRWAPPREAGAGGKARRSLSRERVGRSSRTPRSLAFLFALVLSTPLMDV